MLIFQLDEVTKHYPLHIKPFILRIADPSTEILPAHGLKCRELQFPGAISGHVDELVILKRTT